MKTCGAKTRDGDPCKNAQMANGRCRMHGGKIPQGIALPQTTEGRYSKHLPTRMLTAYQESRRDPNLLALYEEVSLVDTKLAELLAKVDTGESGATWKAVYDALAAFKRANQRKDADAAREAMNDLERFITRGYSSSGSWDELQRWIETRRKLSESERKRLVEMQQMVTGEQAMLLVTALTQAVRDHVRDPDTLRAITAELGRIAPGALT